MRFNHEALKTARADLSQEALAAKAGVTTSTVSRLERGEIENPGSATVVRLALALDIDPADLLILEASA